MLQFHSEGDWKHRAIWGDKDAITFGNAGTPEKLPIGDAAEDRANGCNSR